MSAKPVHFTYTNWQNKTAVRHVFPIQVWFGVTQYHHEPQWFLKAYDIGKGEERDFTMKDISAWMS